MSELKGLTDNQLRTRMAECEMAIKAAAGKFTEYDFRMRDYQQEAVRRLNDKLKSLEGTGA